MWMGFDIFGWKNCHRRHSQLFRLRAEIQSNKGHHPVPHKSFVPIRFCHVIDWTSWKLVRCPKLHKAISDITASGHYLCNTAIAKQTLHGTSKHQNHIFYQIGYTGVWRQKMLHLCILWQASKGTWFDNQFVKLLRISPTSVSFLVTLVTHMDWKVPNFSNQNTARITRSSTKKVSLIIIFFCFSKKKSATSWSSWIPGSTAEVHKIFVDEDKGKKEGQAKKDCFGKVNDPARVTNGCNFQATRIMFQMVS